MLRLKCSFAGWMMVAVFLTAPALRAETVQQACQRIHDQAAAMQLGESWGERTALEDCRRLQGVLAQIQSVLAQPSLYRRETLLEAATALTSARQRLRISATFLPTETVAAWSVDLEKLEARLREATRAFDGRALPPRERLAQADLNQKEALPIESAEDLAREARGIRFQLQSLRNPSGLNPFSLNWGGPDGWTSRDLQELWLAVYDYESACRAPYRHVVETRPAFRRLVRSSDRVAYLSSNLDSFTWQRIERTLERLKRFYGWFDGGAEADR